MAYDHLAAIFTLISVVAFGKKKVILGSILGLIASIFWWILTFQLEQWGLMYLNITMPLLYGYNIWQEGRSNDSKQGRIRERKPKLRPTKRNNRARNFGVPTGGRVNNSP